MEPKCKQNIQTILQGFHECQYSFTAIGDETRQLILLTLLQSDLSGIRVGELASKVHLTRPSVSHHLQILKEAGIVAMRKEGTKNYYYLSVNDTKWKEMADLITLIYTSIQHLETDKGR